MKKTLTVAALALFALASLATASSTTLATTDQSKNAAIYRLLSSPSSMRTFDVMKQPRAWHVKALATNGSYTWVNKVEGKGKLCPNGTDMLSLNDGNVLKEGTKPVGPYIVGCSADNGVFTPSSTEVLLP